MKRLILSMLLGLMTAAPAAAQYGPFGGQGYRDASSTVAQWYQRFLGRPPDDYAAGWVQALQSGQSAEQVMSGILGSDEYYNRKGGTPRGFIQGLYADLTGRPPTPQEEMFWARQVYSRPRADISYDVLTRQAQNWNWDGNDPGHDPRYDYRRPNYRFR